MTLFSLPVFLIFFGISTVGWFALGFWFKEPDLPQRFPVWFISYSIGYILVASIFEATSGS
jgi:hypothetical protein